MGHVGPWWFHPRHGWRSLGSGRWRLHTGRMARKDTGGVKWHWVSTNEVSADNLETAEKSDLIFVKGLGSAVKPGFSVVNSEYIAFHPHQCLPMYEIEYEMD